MLKTKGNLYKLTKCSGGRWTFRDRNVKAFNYKIGNIFFFLDNIHDNIDDEQRYNFYVLIDNKILTSFLNSNEYDKFDTIFQKLT